MASSTIDSPNMSRPSSAIAPRPPRSRTQSISSDRPSTIALSLMSPPLTVSPEAGFIAASAASQIVTNDHDSHANTWYDQHGIEPAAEAALVSPGALQLVNNFLDQLLFNFLHLSRATSLSALRPAVTEVLKPKLAKDAINNADEELREYLGGSDEEDYSQPNSATSARDWDVELAWKRTRLRCMVYSSLGDMEEEDEDLYMEQENLEIGANESSSGVISPAVAIFLTSVLEYMGELTLTVAGQAAYHRMRAKLEKDLKEGTRSTSDMADRIVVEELDMERVALDRTLGRLWRGWKKRIRSPGMEAVGRPFSRASMGHLRQDSSAAETVIDTEAKKHLDGGAIAEDVLPADIALPIGKNDIDEIEVPGLAVYSDEEDEEEEDDGEGFQFKRQRPKSLMILPLAALNGLPTPVSQPQTPLLSTRKRSNSLPTPGTSPYRGKGNKHPVVEKTSDADKSTKDEATKQPASSPEKAAESEPIEEPTPKAPTRAKRPSNIFTGVSTPGAAAMAGITAVAQRRASGTNLDDADETASYEQAEILTSARISVAGSISPAISEPGGPFSLKRSSSLHSARIIDVVGPKSPSGSRSPSVETPDRMRPVSLTLSRASSISNQSGTEEPRLPKVLENVTRASRNSSSRSPVDRMRGSFSNATISESEEEEAELGMDQKTPRNANFPASALAATIPAAANARRAVSQPYSGSSSRTPSGARYPAPSETKTTAINASSSSNSFQSDKPPEVPRKAPNHASRRAPQPDNAPLSPTESIGAVSVERMKTKASDEDVDSSGHGASRPIHTSSSSTSSGTGRLKAVRTSEESGSNRADNMARDFEELIKGNQTITYTLTPENMRGPDSKHSFDGSSINLKGLRRSEDTRTAHSRSRSSSATTEARATSSHRRKAGLNSHPVRDTSEPRGSPVSKVPGSAGGRATRSASVKAREARVPEASTADFAEFIKSTGPVGEVRPPAVRHVSNPSKTSIDSRRAPSSSGTRSRYQPRDAVIDNRTDNSDLIDFIRQGPPSASQNPRIPRTVAPFRNTMDSDQMSGAVGGKAIDATLPDIRYSEASTHGTEASMPSLPSAPSVQSSVNSHTALLKTKAPLPPPSSNMFDDEDMMPKRKTRRVKDPYAIDFSDEEDDEFMVTPKPPVKKEESLAEFLRNYDPPPEPVAPPISEKIPKKKASAPSLMSRFTRGHHSSSSVSSTPPVPPAKEARSLNSRSGFKGYIPLQVSMPSYDKYGRSENKATPPPPPLPMSMAPPPSSSGRVPMKRFEPREAVSNVSRTSDLASFLRDSEPPPEPIVRSPPPQEESSGLAKMFGRRKKSSVS